MEPTSVTFALEDKSRDYEVTPDRVPIDDLIQFSKDVKDFVQGAEKDVPKEEIVVAIKKGSFALEVPSLTSQNLFDDLKTIGSGLDISSIDSKRKQIIESWQKSSKLNIFKHFRIESSAFLKIIRIDFRSQFITEKKEHWVNVERYVRGELQDLGGVKKSNAHLRLHGGKSLTIKTDKAIVKAQSTNHVYHDVTVRIKAKLNLFTGEIKDAELLEFIEYEPKFDEEQFKQMTDKGQKAWSDVDDHVKWVRELRGSD